jgi:hypothetical protein
LTLAEIGVWRLIPVQIRSFKLTATIRNDPLVVKIGVGDVIKGWDEGMFSRALPLQSVEEY